MQGIQNKCIIFCILIIVLCGCDLPGKYGTITGTVLDGFTEKPLSSVTVQICSATAVTEDNGTFLMQGVPSGTRTITASKPGYYTYSQNIEVAGGSSSFCAIHLAAKNPPAGVARGAVSGSVSDTETGAALANVIVKIGYQSGVSNTNGEFSINTILTGNKIITAFKPGYHTYEAALEISDGTVIEHNIQLSSADAVPSPPEGLSIAAGDGATALSWQNVSEATTYNLYWQTRPEVTADTGTRISGVKSPFLHSGLTNGTAYYYTITAENSLGESTETREVYATPAFCSETLDNETLHNLSITTPFRCMQVRPGEELDFELGTVECCVFFKPVDTCATWSVTPETGATINPLTGLFTVGQAAHNGMVFTIAVDIEHGRRILTRDVYVYTPEENPFVGFWHELTQLSCTNGQAQTPDDPINEFVFDANGRFSVTWYPFEIYTDYWGTYTYDLTSGSFDLIVEGGNYVPYPLDEGGAFFINDPGKLFLNSIWLGSYRSPPGIAACGHVLQRY